MYVKNLSTGKLGVMRAHLCIATKLYHYLCLHITESESHISAPFNHVMSALSQQVLLKSILISHIFVLVFRVNFFQEIFLLNNRIVACSVFCLP